MGRAVGELAAAWAAADGADEVWAGTPPTGPGAWQPTPPKFRARPLEPLAGTWRPWVVSAIVALRPPAPPAWGSTAWRAELAAVQLAVARRTPEQAAAVRHWAGGGGTVTPAGLWVETARELILRDRLDSLHAARALALTTIAMHDAFVCCWDAKYAYWTARPITADPTLDVLIPRRRSRPTPRATRPFPPPRRRCSAISSPPMPPAWRRWREKPRIPGSGPVSTFPSTTKPPPPAAGASASSYLPPVVWRSSQPVHRPRPGAFQPPTNREGPATEEGSLRESCIVHPAAAETAWRRPHHDQTRASDTGLGRQPRRSCRDEAADQPTASRHIDVG